MILGRPKKKMAVLGLKMVFLGQYYFIQQNTIKYKGKLDDIAKLSSNRQFQLELNWVSLNFN